MNGYHAGLNYTTEQREVLDALFSTYLRRDNAADAARYDNGLLNTAAEEAYQEYEEAKARFDVVNNSPPILKMVACLQYAIDSGEWFENWNLSAEEVF